MNAFKKAAITAAAIGSALAGGAIGASIIGTAGAQTVTTTTAAPSTSQSAPPAGQQGGPAGQQGGPGGGQGTHDPSKGGHVANNITETLLTGDTATKVTEAANAAVPGGTIQRVENDAEGATYEAHMTKADGSQVTVKLDASFKVTSTEDGMR